MATDTAPRPTFPVVCHRMRRRSARQVVAQLTLWLTRVPGWCREPLHTLVLQLGAGRTSFAAVARRGRHLLSTAWLGKQWRRWRQGQSLDAWETALDTALRAPWREALREERVWVLADWHAVPYWGEVPADLQGEVRRGPAQNGTTSFFTYATAAVLWRGVRIHVGLTRVRAGESQAAVVARLQARVGELGCRVSGWVLDKGFYTAGVVAHLRSAAQPYLIAAPRRGETRGIAALLRQTEQEYGFQDTEPPGCLRPYVLTSLDPAVPPQPTNVVIAWEPVRAPAAAAAPTKPPRRQRTLRRSHVQPGQQWRGVAWIGGGRKWTAKRAQRVYRSRNSIESGYRMAEGTRGRTSSRDPKWRLVLFGLALLLQNAWVWLLTEGQRTGKRWWRRLRASLPYIDFCCWITQVTRGKTGQRMAVDLPGV